MYRILLPDALLGVEPDIEQRVAGADATLEVYFEGAAHTIPPSAWETCDAIVANNRIDLTAAVAERARKCRIVVRTGVGYDRVDPAPFAARGIPVCNTPDYGTTEVADSAMALLLSLARGVGFYERDLRADPVGHWRYDRAPLMSRLRGACFGVVGLGRIGIATARRAAAFDMSIAFYDPYLPNGTELALGFRRARSLAELLGMADVVSLHVPLTAETRGMIGREAVAAMRPGAILINSARGALVDTAALLDGLRSGRLAGLGLDTLAKEPPADDPLVRAWAADEPALRGRIAITPHSAFYSAPALADMRAKSMETAMLFLREGVLRNCVNGVAPGRPV